MYLKASTAIKNLVCKMKDEVVDHQNVLFESCACINVLILHNRPIDVQQNFKLFPQFQLIPFASFACSVAEKYLSLVKLISIKDLAIRPIGLWHAGTHSG